MIIEIKNLPEGVAVSNIKLDIKFEPMTGGTTVPKQEILVEGTPKQQEVKKDIPKEMLDLEF